MKVMPTLPVCQPQSLIETYAHQALYPINTVPIKFVTKREHVKTNISNVCPFFWYWMSFAMSSPTSTNAPTGENKRKFK